MHLSFQYRNHSIVKKYVAFCIFQNSGFYFVSLLIWIYEWSYNLSNLFEFDLWTCLFTHHNLFSLWLLNVHVTPLLLPSIHYHLSFHYYLHVVMRRYTMVYPFIVSLLFACCYVPIHDGLSMFRSLCRWGQKPDWQPQINSGIEGILNINIAKGCTFALQYSSLNH